LRSSNADGTTGGNGSVYYFTSWAASEEGGSAAIKPDGTKATSAFYPGGQSNGMYRFRMEAGKTYTVSATARLTGPQSSPASAARRIAIRSEERRVGEERRGR